MEKRRTGKDRAGREFKRMTKAEILRITLLIRDGGRVNMCHVMGVAQVADSMGYYEFAEWVRQNKSTFFSLILTGEFPDDMKEDTE
jgi:hypothetical protein